MKENQNFYTLWMNDWKILEKIWHSKVWAEMLLNQIKSYLLDRSHSSNNK